MRIVKTDGTLLADITGACLQKSRLSQTDLRGADLSNADLRWADLEGADFTGADRRGADIACTAFVYQAIGLMGVVFATEGPSKGVRTKMSARLAAAVVLAAAIVWLVPVNSRVAHAGATASYATSAQDLRRAMTEWSLAMEETKRKASLNRTGESHGVFVFCIDADDPSVIRYAYSYAKDTHADASRSAVLALGTTRGTCRGEPVFERSVRRRGQ